MNINVKPYGLIFYSSLHVTYSIKVRKSIQYNLLPLHFGNESTRNSSMPKLYFHKREVTFLEEMQTLEEHKRKPYIIHFVWSHWIPFYNDSYNFPMHRCCNWTLQPRLLKAVTCCQPHFITCKSTIWRRLLMVAKELPTTFGLLEVNSVASTTKGCWPMADKP